MADTEIQFKVPSFLAAQLAGLQSRKICPPPPQTLGAVSVRLQRIEFGSNSIRHNEAADIVVKVKSGGTTLGTHVSGRRTQIAQELVIHVAGAQDVLDHPNGPPATVARIPTRAIINLGYQPRGKECLIKFEFDRLEPGQMPALPPGVDPHEVEGLIEREVRKALGPVSTPIDFGKLLPGGITEIANAGVSVNGDGSVLAFRAELGPGTSSSPAAWTNFYGGAVTDHMSGADWGMFLTDKMLIEAFANSIRGSAGSGSGPLEVTKVVGEYSNPSGKAHLQMGIHGKVHPPDPFPTIPIGTEVGIDLSMAEPGFLTVDMFLPDIEGILDQLRTAMKQALWALLGPLALALEGSVDGLLSDVTIPTPTGGLTDCQKLGPLHQRCRIRLPTTPLNGTTLRITSFSALPDGVLLAGRLRVTPLTPSTLESSTREFTWTPPEISCGSASIATIALFSDHVEEMAPVKAEAIIDHSGTTPGYVCDVRVINDPLGKFPQSALRWEDTAMPVRIVLEVPNPGPSYAARPYPVDLLVTTTLGARLIRFAPAPALTQQDIDHLVATVLVKVGSCTLLVEPRFNLKWLIDPPFIDTIVHHYWEILIEGLQHGDALTLSSAAGKQLAHVSVLPGIATMLTALVAPLAGEELQFMRIRDGDVGLSEADFGIEIRQQLLQLQAAVPLAATCQGVLASMLWSEHGAIAVLDQQLLALDLSNPARPRRIASWDVDGLLGALERPDGLLAFSADGFFEIDREQRLTRVGPEQEPSRIRGAALGDGVVHVLTKRALEVRSPQLEPRSSLPLRGGRCLLRLGERLIVGSRLGVTVFRTGEGGEVAGEGKSSCPDIKVVGLERAPLAGDGQILARLENGSARMLAIGEDDRTQEVAEFRETPWFAGGIRLERATVLVGSDSRTLQISTQGESRLVGAEATSLSS